MTIIAFISGLAIFLFAMAKLESGLREASGAGFKNWIINRTKTPLSSASAGVIITAILQSSSMVSLLTLAFVSAGVMSLFSAIGVVLGANLGTTVTGWIVALVGFKLDLDSFVLPLLGVGALASLGYVKNVRLRGIGRAVFGFGLLIFGLSVMKESVAGLTALVDLNDSAHLHAGIYLLIGLVLAAVMQSSSAVMMMTLALLSSQAIQLVDAAALMIGADIGTTSTTILGSVGQSVVKKQLAFAHVFFNLLVDLMAFFVLLPLLPYWLNLIGVTDQMFGLVVFHSTFNLLGLLMFLPILRRYTQWIERIIPVAKDNRSTLFEVPVEVPEAAIASLWAAVVCLAQDAIRLNLLRVGIQSKVKSDNRYRSGHEQPIQDQYQAIKQFENNIIQFAQRLRLTSISHLEDSTVSDLLEATRAIVYASKTLKDIQHDFDAISHTAIGSSGHRLAEAHQHFLENFYTAYVHAISQIAALQASEQNLELVELNNDETVRYVISKLTDLNAKHHQSCSDMIINFDHGQQTISATISTWFNLNHEVHHHARYMISALTQLEQISSLSDG